MSSRRVSGNSSFNVTVIGVPAIQRALRGWLEPELTDNLDKATKAAAKEFAKAVKAEVAPVSKRMRSAVRVKRAKTGRPGWVVGSKRKIAFFWPFVIGGTKAHGVKRKRLMFWLDDAATPHVARHVRGVPPNDLVERAANKVEAKAFREADTEMSRSAPL